MGTPIRSLYDCGAYYSATIDLGNSATDGTERTIDISFPMEHIEQIWLVGWLFNTTGQDLTRIEFAGPSSLHIRPLITNLAGGPAVILFTPTAAVGLQHSQASNPIPLLEESINTGGRQVKLRFRVTNSTGGAATYTRLILHFFITQVKSGERFDTGTYTLGTQRRHEGMNAF